MLATLADLVQVMRRLSSDANRIQVSFVILDSERDTPELLAKFVPSFDPSFLGLYGDTQTTARVAEQFGVKFEKHIGQHGGYMLDHSDGIYLFGTTGKPSLLSPHGQRADLQAQDSRLLLTTGR